MGRGRYVGHSHHAPLAPSDRAGSMGVGGGDGGRKGSGVQNIQRKRRRKKNEKSDENEMCLIFWWRQGALLGGAVESEDLVDGGGRRGQAFMNV